MYNPFDRKSDFRKYNDKDIIVLCEGHDEVAVVSRLCNNNRTYRIGIAENNEIVSELKAIRTSAELNDHRYVLLLVFDVEQNRSDRKKYLQAQLAEAGFVYSDLEGQLAMNKVSEDSNIQVSYWLNPHNQESGSIEDLFVDQVKHSEFGSCVDSYVQCIVKNGSKTSPNKAMMRAYLACYNKGYNTSLHVGLQDPKVLSVGTPLFDSLRSLLESALTAFTQA